MNIKALQHPDKRVELRYNSTLHIQAYGHDNLYPQMALSVAMASPNGRQCLERYATFVEGDGLADIALADTVVNRHRQTMRDIHHLVARDVAYFGGFALHVNYNTAGRIVEIQHEPFENCRLEECDDDGYVACIVTHPDWSGSATRNGERLRPDKDSVERVDVFAPHRVLAQIEAVGGVAYYDGQIQWNSLSGWRRYPTTKYDGVLTDMSTDEGLSNVRNRNVRNNFLPAGMFVTKRGTTFEGEDDRDVSYSGELSQLQGDINALKMLEVQVDVNEEAPEFRVIEGLNTDKMFNETTESTIDNIYSAFNQEVFLSLRRGKIGFSGNLVQDAWRDYAAQVRKEQRFISSAYAKIFAVWDGAEFSDFEILPVKFLTI